MLFILHSLYYKQYTYIKQKVELYFFSTDVTRDLCRSLIVTVGNIVTPIGFFKIALNRVADLDCVSGHLSVLITQSTLSLQKCSLPISVYKSLWTFGNFVLFILYLQGNQKYKDILQLFLSIYCNNKMRLNYHINL